MSTGPSPEVRTQILLRSGCMCERCGSPANDIHHRRARSRGGSKAGWINQPANLVALCGHGNTGGCHGWVHSHPIDAKAYGWTLSTYADEDPSDVPLTRPDGRRFYIDNEGRRDDVGHGRKAS